MSGFRHRYPAGFDPNEAKIDEDLERRAFERDDSPLVRSAPPMTPARLVSLQQYELVPFDGDGREMGRFIVRKSGDNAARLHAGRVAKVNNGPCDLARAGNAEWNDRYLTTAAPSEFHASGFRFERLA